MLSKKEKLMAEGYRKYAKESEKLCREMEPASSEAWALLELYDRKIRLPFAGNNVESRLLPENKLGAGLGVLSRFFRNPFINSPQGEYCVV